MVALGIPIAVQYCARAALDLPRAAGKRWLRVGDEVSRDAIEQERNPADGTEWLTSVPSKPHWGAPADLRLHSAMRPVEFSIALPRRVARPIEMDLGARYPETAGPANTRGERLLDRLFNPVLLSFLLATPEASACQDVTFPETTATPYCSKTLYGTGTCNGQDQLALINTNDPQGNPWEGPWEDHSITIIGVTLAAFEVPESGFNYIFAGNSYAPDIMAFLSAGEKHGVSWFPSGGGFQFPAKGTAGTPHIDMHVSCASGKYQVYEVIYYYVNR